jgi:biotin carboxyl carrier protein
LVFSLQKGIGRIWFGSSKIFGKVWATMKYQLTTKEHTLQLEMKQGKAFRNGVELPFQIVSQTEGEVVLLIENQVFKIRSLPKDEEGSGWNAYINGKRVNLSIQSETDLLIEKMGGANAGQLTSKNIKAPMPGLIVKLVASPGDTVEKGQVLLNFEAMKMENQLKSPGNGVIKNILVKPGDKVEKNQLLIEMA